MGFFGKLFGKKPDAAPAAPARENHAADTTCEQDVVYAPVEGELVPMAAVDDVVFNSECLGKGIAVNPRKGVVCAPFDGKVTMIAGTGHAVRVVSAAGIDVLVHVGLNTVELNGEGFTTLVKAEEEVKKGEALIKFDMALITGKGYALTSPVVVCNIDDYTAINTVAEGSAVIGEPLIKVAK